MKSCIFFCLLISVFSAILPITVILDAISSRGDYRLSINSLRNKPVGEHLVKLRTAYDSYIDQLQIPIPKEGVKLNIDSSYKFQNWIIKLKEIEKDSFFIVLSRLWEKKQIVVDRVPLQTACQLGLAHEPAYKIELKLFGGCQMRIKAQLCDEYIQQIVKNNLCCEKA